MDVSRSNSSAVNGEFISLMAVLMSFVALSIDAMLPALEQMGRDLHVSHPNDVQLVISSIFFGMVFGILFFGPFSDAYGRKPAIYFGISVFFVGCVASILSSTFEVMIAGRILQGLGAASCRVVTLAMIRDRYEGRAMAKVMSLVLIMFILVPALAPSLGQGIMMVASWRAIFFFMITVSVLSAIWLKMRLPETLKPQKRIRFSIKTILNGAVETLSNRTTLGYTVAAALSFSGLLGYLLSSQQIIQIQYGFGNLFAVLFGLLALCIGMASFANSRLVERFGMETLCKNSLTVLVIVSSVFLPFCFYFNGHPPFAFLYSYLATTFFCFGILFGNLGALAIQPLGHIAGVASSVIGSLQTLISVVLGGFIGYSYNGTVIPLCLGIICLTVCSLIIVVRLTPSSPAPKYASCDEKVDKMDP